LPVSNFRAESAESTGLSASSMRDCLFTTIPEVSPLATFSVRFQRKFELPNSF
jgi:hypothetical protein